MAKDLSDFTVGEGGQIIPLGKGNSDEDSILRIRREKKETNKEENVTYDNSIQNINPQLELN